MWRRLILPECRTCKERFAADWTDRLCVICRAEVEALEESLAMEASE